MLLDKTKSKSETQIWFYTKPNSRPGTFGSTVPVFPQTSDSNLLFLPATTIGESKTYATSAMFTVDYSGPMGVMIRGMQEEYKVEGDTADCV